MASAKEVISVRMTRICMPFSKARYSAACQCYLRSDQSLNYRVVCQVQKHGNMVRKRRSPRRYVAEEVCHIVL